MATVSIIILPIFLLCMFAAVFVVVFVYRDAQKRDMNAIGWALIAVLVPLFLGLIMYLLCRKPLVEMQCPQCGAGVTPQTKVCPQCGNKFVTQCPQCEFPVQKGWSACPSCGTPLPESYGQPVRAYKKDNGIWGLVVVVVLVLLAFFLAIFSICTLSRIDSNIEQSVGYGGYEGMYNITAEDMAGNTTISEWIAACGEDEDVYVLLSTASDTCLIYLPGQEKLMRSDLNIEYSSSDKCYACVYVTTTKYEDKYGYDFFLYEFEVCEETDVDVFIDDEYYYDVTVTMTDKDISMKSWGGQENE